MFEVLDLNTTWARAKADLLTSVKTKDFYFARYQRTRATVYAEEAEADLALSVRSGPRVRMGKLYTDGLKRVPRTLIERYVVYQPGDPYDQDKLDSWQQALQSTTFFRGAFVTLDEESTDQRVDADGEMEIPVLVRVTEAPAQRFTGSIGVDSDYGLRIEGLYRHNVIFGLPLWSETGLGVDKKRQRFFHDVHFPPTVGGFRHSLGTIYERYNIEGVRQTRAAAGLKTKYDFDGRGRTEYETQWSLMAVWNKTYIKGIPGRQESTAIEGLGQILRRDVNDKYDPRQGNLIDLDFGVHYPLKRKYDTLYRTGLRVQQWFPIGRRDVLTVRGEIGRVWPYNDYIPLGFGFRTGGARSIRGYKYQSIGLHRGHAVVGAPAMAVASIEYTRYFTEMLGMSERSGRSGSGIRSGGIRLPVRITALISCLRPSGMPIVLCSVKASCVKTAACRGCVPMPNRRSRSVMWTANRLKWTRWWCQPSTTLKFRKTTSVKR